MRVAAILGPGNLARPLAAFRREAKATWTSLIEQADVIVIFGGDGTVHRNLQTLVELGAPVLIVPCGSGNDFARALGIRTVRDSVSAFKSYLAGASNVRSIDLGVIHELGHSQPIAPSGEDATMRYFCCVAGVGLDTQIARQANSLPRWLRAHGGYGLSATREFLRFAPFPMKISPDGYMPSSFQSTTLAAVANTPAYGGGMKIAPHAKLDDGKLDVCIVRALDKFHLFWLFPTVYFGRHLSFAKVEYAQAPTARIETESPFEVYADGEFVCQTPVEFSVAPGVLQVIIP
jgi:diacylglycerol kinase (ATP)